MERYQPKKSPPPPRPHPGHSQTPFLQKKSHRVSPTHSPLHPHKSFIEIETPKNTPPNSPIPRGLNTYVHGQTRPASSVEKKEENHERALVAETTKRYESLLSINQSINDLINQSTHQYRNEDEKRRRRAAMSFFHLLFFLYVCLFNHPFFIQKKKKARPSIHPNFRFPLPSPILPNPLLHHPAPVPSLPRSRHLPFT